MCIDVEFIRIDKKAEIWISSHFNVYGMIYSLQFFLEHIWYKMITSQLNNNWCTFVHCNRNRIYSFENSSYDPFSFIFIYTHIYIHTFRQTNKIEMIESGKNDYRDEKKKQEQKKKSNKKQKKLRHVRALTSRSIHSHHKWNGDEIKEK